MVKSKNNSFPENWKGFLIFFFLIQRLEKMILLFTLESKQSCVFVSKAFGFNVINLVFIQPWHIGPDRSTIPNLFGLFVVFNVYNI